MLHHPFNSLHAITNATADALASFATFMAGIPFEVIFWGAILAACAPRIRARLAFRVNIGGHIKSAA